MSNFILAEQTHAAVRAQKWQAAVLPFGATEPHNFHLPYGTDIFEADIIARRACAHASEKGAKVLLLPTIPFGVNTNHLKIPGAVAISLTPTTLLKILEDVTDSLQRQNIRKLLLLNSHGGNDLKALTRELHHRTGVFICVCDWFKLAADVIKQIFEAPGEHADEVETSLALAFFSQFVHMKDAGSGATNKTRFDAINKGWIGITRPWHLLTPDTGAGNPAAANAQKGEALMQILQHRIGDFLAELSASEMNQNFPF